MTETLLVAQNKIIALNGEQGGSYSAFAILHQDNEHANVMHQFKKIFAEEADARNFIAVELNLHPERYFPVEARTSQYWNPFVNMDFYRIVADN